MADSPSLQLFYPAKRTDERLLRRVLDERGVVVVIVYWCLTHNANAEGPVARCWYALYSEALERCELAEAEIKLTDDPEPKYQTEPLPTVEEWINTHGPW